MTNNIETHVLWETGDADRPNVICDSNGEVVLGLCRVCGRGEIELFENACHEKALILHALGLTKRGGKMPRWGHRNYFAAGSGSPDQEVWKGLVDRGLAIAHREPGEGSPYSSLQCFQVTDLGIKAARVDGRVRKEDRVP